MNYPMIIPGYWDYQSYAQIPHDGLRHEIIEGHHYMNASPNLYHQEISRRLQFQLYVPIEEASLGFFINAPVDVELGPRNIVQPDLVVIRHSRKHIMTPIKVKGIPDLLIEILSPSNAEHDLVRKRTMYEYVGVPEYWIVSPDDHKITKLELRDGLYHESEFSDEIAYDLPPPIRVDLTRVW